MRWCQCAVVLHLRVSDIKATDQGSRWQQTSCAQCPDLDDFDREARLAPENNWFTRPEGVRGHLRCAVGQRVVCRLPETGVGTCGIAKGACFRNLNPTYGD